VCVPVPDGCPECFKVSASRRSRSVKRIRATSRTSDLRDTLPRPPFEKIADRVRDVLGACCVRAMFLTVDIQDIVDERRGAGLRPVLAGEVRLESCFSFSTVRFAAARADERCSVSDDPLLASLVEP
jgi:hypothetical protein